MSERRTALIVFHGIGQQREFETLNAVADAIQRDFAGGFHVSLFRDAEDILPCSTLTVNDQCVDLYEAYWSPWTKGKVSLSAIILFLLQAGWRGLFTIAFKRGRFHRALFDGVETFTVPIATTLQLTFLMLLIAALTAFGLAGSWVALGYAVLVMGLPVFDQCLLRDLRTWLYLLSAVEVAIVILTVAARGLMTTVGFKKAGPVLYSVILLLASTIIAGTLPLVHCIMSYWNGHESRPSPIAFMRNCDAAPSIDTWMAQLDSIVWFHEVFRAWGINGWFGWLVLTLFALTGVAGYIFFMRERLAAYLGDVVAYLAAYRANEFYSLREEIRKRCLRLTNAVVHRTGLQGTGYYDSIVFVGHSLGSVIAYDTLNTLLQGDSADGALPGAISHRIRGLITLGSPLDKAVFLFRTDPESARVTPRGKIMLAQQPLAGNRRLREQLLWVNFYSALDPIGGKLDYYDPAGNWPWVGRVINVHDRHSTLPLAAHTEYWSHPELQEVLRLFVSNRSIEEVRRRVRDLASP